MQKGFGVGQVFGHVEVCVRLPLRYFGAELFLGLGVLGKVFERRTKYRCADVDIGEENLTKGGQELGRISVNDLCCWQKSEDESCFHLPLLQSCHPTERSHAR